MSAQPTRPAEIKALAGARAVPPLILVLFHYCSFHHHVPAASVLGPPILKGYLWVEFFFALSGFILIHVYGHRVGEFWRAKNCLTFVKMRLARLYPVHLAALLSMAILMLALRVLDHAAYASMYEGVHAPLNTWQTFIANLVLVQAWNTVPDLAWNAPAWFVSVEFLLCLMFPLFLLLSRGGLWRGVLIIAAGIVWLTVLAVPSGVGLDITINNGVFRGMAGFGIGVGLALVYREAVAAGARRVPEWVFSLAQGAVLLFLVYALYGSGPDHTGADVWTAGAVDALVLVLAFDRGFLARLFATRPLLKLGEWSYGIYLGQMFWLQIARYLEQQQLIPAAAPTWLEPFSVVLVCIAWGALLAKFVERPANAALRRRFAQRNAPRPT